LPETLPFWEAANEGRLSIQFCRTCEHYYFYPRSFCRYCQSREVEWRDVSGRGRLVSYNINYRPMPPLEGGGPLIIALVELEEGPRMLTNIVDAPFDPDALPLDAPVTVTFDTSGEWALPMFKLAEAS
jgi:hypothetical protein